MGDIRVTEAHTTKVEAQNLSPSPFEQMEKTQQKVTPYLQSLEPTQDPTPLFNYPQKLIDDAIELAEEINGAPSEHTSAIRRLHALLNRISAATEKHIFMKKERDYEKKMETLEKVGNIASWTRGQGWTSAGAGFGSPILLFLGKLVGGEIGNAIQTLASLTDPGSRALNSFIESWKKGDEFDQQLYLNTSSSDRQALEGLKNMPRELQQKLMQLLQQEKEAIRASGQR